MTEEAEKGEEEVRHARPAVLCMSAKASVSGTTLGLGEAQPELR